VGVPNVGHDPDLLPLDPKPSNPAFRRAEFQQPANQPVPPTKPAAKAASEGGTLEKCESTSGTDELRPGLSSRGSKCSTGHDEIIP